MIVLKRNGTKEEYSSTKIKIAVGKAMVQVGETDPAIPEGVEGYVRHNLEGYEVVKVEDLHRKVEDALMNYNYFNIAREYISYRSQHMPDMFRPRKAYRPFEYPQLSKFVDAIHQSFWTFRHFNYDSDVQAFKVSLSDHERKVVTRAMLAIGQIESSVKTFWGKIGDYLPKPEIMEVGASFSDSEVRHAHAYTHLLEILGLNQEFANIDEHPALSSRRDYLIKKLEKSDSKEDFIVKVLLFSVFVENVSLFSQFLVMMSFDKYDNKLNGLANAIQATSKEEDIHFQFGVELINILREESPELFTKELEDRVVLEARKALMAEEDLVEWMFDGENLPFLSRLDVKAFISHRMRSSLAELDIDFPIEFRYQTRGKFSWFEEERVVPSNIDFFHKKSVDYSKGTQSITEDDLF